jgi:hypothetical protein
MAGWYPDPQDAGAWRWWSGTGWTNDVAPRPGAVQAPADEAPRRSADWGWDNTPVLAAGGAATLAPERAVGPSAPSKAPRAAKAARPAPAARATTLWIWLLAFSPIIYGTIVGALRVYALPLFAGQGTDTLMIAGIGTLLLPLVLLWIFADLDGRALRKRGFDAPSVLWMLLLPPVAYFVRRGVTVKRGGGRSFAPQLTLFIVYAVLVAGVIVQLGAILALLPFVGSSVGLPG